MRARHRRAPVAKARYYGLASGGANQLPAAAARAFTPSPDRPPGPRPSTELLISSRRCDPGTLPPDCSTQVSLLIALLAVSRTAGRGDYCIFTTTMDVPTTSSSRQAGASGVSTGGGSHPDLSKLSTLTVDPQITFRNNKRRLQADVECGCSYEITGIKSELMRIGTLLEKYVDSNEQIINKMQESISEVKVQITELKSYNEQTAELIRENAIQIKDLKLSVSNISSDQIKLKSQMLKLENKLCSDEEKIKSIESNIRTSTLDKLSTLSTNSQLPLDEHIIKEVLDRNNRKNNVIILGLQEQTAANAKDRTDKDEVEVLKIIKTLGLDPPKPNKVFRLDQTPAQQKYLRDLKDELTRRQSKDNSINTYQVTNNYKDIESNKSRLRFFYLNARSICGRGKLDELKCILQALPSTVHLILLTETWITSDLQAMLLKINNYTHYYSYRTDSRGGGVSAYVHNDLKHNLSMAVYAGGNNYLWIHLERYDLEVGVVYNPGDTNFQEFLQTYEDQLQQRKRAIVFGDFNIDLLTKDRQTRTYNQLLREAGHTIINKLNKKHCTRESKTRKSILDHVSSNLKNDNFHMALIDSSMSDHKQIFVELKKSKPPCKIRTQYEAIDYPNLQNLLKKSNLEEVGDDYHLLENESRTIKTKILNPPQNDWINKDIIENINQRNELWMKFKKHPDDNNVEAKYIEKRQEVHKQIQNTKKSYYNKKFNSCMDKPKRMWNLVNMLANNKVKQSSAPSKLLIDTKYVTDTKQISEIFNNNSLSWNAHLDHIKIKLSTLIYTLRTLVKCIPNKLKYTIYNALVKPHLQYLIEIWGNTAKTKLNELQIMQNKLVKIIFSITSYINEQSRVEII
ncbi:hypothetical protein SFRURICE_017874 [Spodoptera frugiperda]|nr:hypothetical protein SFRURICE_017874 [Spodoptera frugiperda]